MRRKNMRRMKLTIFSRFRSFGRGMHQMLSQHQSCRREVLNLDESRYGQRTRKMMKSESQPMEGALL